ncbi:hypothetical protein [Paenisporosarcina quisquiliarum]|uniref:hypothetical protein n=1 Tax=Paenisporosarcina quisquiliarum TaxID=365346 RepID=UPI003735A754
MSTKGRKPQIYPGEIIDKIIYQYLQLNKNTGLIKYLDVHRFSQELFNKGETLNNFSEDFWRKPGRQGRKAIDGANEVLEHTISVSGISEDKVIDSIDAVNKFFIGKNENKEKLIGALLINENKLKKYILKNQKIESDLKKRINEIELLKGVNQNYLKMLNEYEKIFFQWLDASSHEDVPLINLITTGKTRNKVVQHLFNTMFSENPNQGYEKFQEFRKNIRKEELNNNTKIVSFREKKENSLIEDFNL